jgi:16S rRNA (cytosine1402-N4)-methyltransferase
LTVHIPVLVEEVIEGLQPKSGDVIIDGTLGGGGHTSRLLDLVGETGRVIGFDRDPAAVEETTGRIDDPRFSAYVANYADIPEYLNELEVGPVNGILLDLGLSSDQLEDRERGFSYQSEGPLDLRFNPLAGESAAKMVNRLNEKSLANVIYEFGEERLSRRIARKIVAVRRVERIETSQQLAKLVRSCVPRSKNHSIDPATRTFQALRIAVNEELKWLKVSMKRLPERLAPRGRLAVISFHSLEDRIVKHSLLENDSMKVLTRKPIQGTPEEIDKNPRSRSAKLRVAERLADPAVS